LAQVSPAVPVQTDPLVESSGDFSDPLFNAARKAPHPDAVIVKQEAGWFQLKEAERLKKTAEKLAKQREREHLVKENEEQRKKNERLEQLIKEKLGGNIEALLFGKLDRPSPSTSAPILQGVQAMAVPAAGENFLPQESPFNPEKFIPGQVI
jgi:predicted phosphohydrolase